MKKKKMIINLLTALLLIGFTIVLLNYVNQTMEPVRVLTFKSTLAEDEIITMDDLVYVELPQRALRSNMLKNPDEVVGMYTNNRVYSGHFVFSEYLKEVESISPFKEIDFSLFNKVPLPLTYDTGLGGDFNPGDLVDLFFVGKGRSPEDNNEFVYSNRFMSQVMVYKVLTKDGLTYDNKTNFRTLEVEIGENMVGENVQVAMDEKEFAQIVLLLTPEQTEEFFARETAGNIRVAGTFGNSVSYETEGFVIGDFSNVFTGRVSVETNRGTSLGISNNPKEYYKPIESFEDLPNMGDLIEEISQEEENGSDDN